jgi:hypothetical protein
LRLGQSAPKEILWDHFKKLRIDRISLKEVRWPAKIIHHGQQPSVVDRFSLHNSGVAATEHKPPQSHQSRPRVEVKVAMLTAGASRNFASPRPIGKFRRAKFGRASYFSEVGWAPHRKSPVLWQIGNEKHGRKGTGPSPGGHSKAGARARGETPQCNSQLTPAANFHIGLVIANSILR